MKGIHLIIPCCTFRGEAGEDLRMHHHGSGHLSHPRPQKLGFCYHTSSRAEGALERCSPPVAFRSKNSMHQNISLLTTPLHCLAHGLVCVATCSPSPTSHLASGILLQPSCRHRDAHWMLLSSARRLAQFSFSLLKFLCDRSLFPGRLLLPDLPSASLNVALWSSSPSFLPALEGMATSTLFLFNVYNHFSSPPVHLRVAQTPGTPVSRNKP